MRRLLLLVCFVFLLDAAPAAAQSPAGCVSSGFNVEPSWSQAKVRAGQGVTLKVVASQPGGTACDMTATTVTLAMPGTNGDPSATATSLAENASYPYNMAPTTLGQVPYTVPANPSFAQAKARVTVSGLVMNKPGGSAFTTTREVALPIVAPKLGLAITADPATGTVPLTVVYHFTLTNLGAPADPLGSVQLAHQYCTPAYESGDTTPDNAIGATETWRYSCTRVFGAVGTYSATSGAAAISSSDGGGVEATPVTTVVSVVAPSQSAGHLTLMTLASPASGFAPLSVLYNYSVRNDSSASVPISNLTVVDAGCSPVTTLAANIPLAVGASRVFNCSRVFGSVGTFGSGAIASGTDATTGLTVSSAQVSTEITTVAAPAATASPTPVATPGPVVGAAPTPTPAPAAKPSTRVVFTAAGRFARPCRGTIKLTLKAGTKVLARKSVKPSSKCSYRVRFDIARTRLGKATRVTAGAKLGKRSKTQRLSVPKT